MSEKPNNRQPLSRFGAWALAFGCVVGWGCFVMPGTLFLPNAGPLGTAIGLGIGGIFMIVIALNYNRMIQRYPVHGGAFVYADETFGHGHAFACGWFLLLALFSILTQNGSALALVSRNLMGHFAEFGFSYSMAGFETFFGEILLSIVAFAVVAVLVARRIKLTYILQAIFAICIVAFLAAVVWAMATGSMPGPLEISPAFNPDKPAALGVLTVISVAPWAFVGFDIVSHVADELSFPVRKIGGVMIAAIVASALVYIGSNTAASAVVPAQYGSWAEHIAATGKLSGIASIPTFDAIITTFGPYGNLLLDVAALGAVLSGIVGSFVAMSRLVTAMAEHGQLPHQLADRSRKTGSPVNTIIAIFILASVFMFLGRSVLSWMMDMSSIGAAIAFFYTSAAALKIARKENRAALAITGAIGAAFSVLVVVILVLPIPHLGTSLSMQSFVFLMAWIALGLNFYMPTHARSERLEQLRQTQEKRAASEKPEG